jgi:DNA-directed RNA polymerase specialized sigma24 family protein
LLPPNARAIHDLGENTMARIDVLVQQCLDRLSGADPKLASRALRDLIKLSRPRMEVLSRKMLSPSLKEKSIGWEDVYQEAALRLCRALESGHPKTAREFFGLAALQIRRVSLDRWRT